MTVPVTTSSNLNQPTVLKRAFQEFVTSNDLAVFFGAGEDAAIQMKIDTSKGRGDTVYFSLMAALDTANIVSGSTNLAGNEQDITLYEDGVTIDWKRAGVKVEHRKLVDLRTPVEIVRFMRPLILDQMARGLQQDIIDSADVTATPNRTRVLFGATDANYDATLATALANIDSTNDKLTVDMIYKAVDKARNLASASGGVTSRKIRPIKVQMKSGARMETYALLVDGIGARQLKSDPEFQELRDTDMKNEIAQAYFTGHNFLGAVDGVMIFRVDDLSRLVKAGAGAGTPAIDVSHALLIGAQAFAVAFGLTGEFVVGTGATDTDYGRDDKIGYNTIRGQKMLSFNSVEQGVVHIFHSGEY